MTVIDCLKPLTLSAVGNGDRMLRNKFFCCLQMPGGAGTLSTAKCPAPVGTHRSTNARGLPGGMLAAGIVSHITYNKLICYEERERQILPCYRIINCSSQLNFLDKLQ